MKKIFITLVCFLIIFIFSSIASSKIALLSLSDMVEKAEMIVIGKVVGVEETNEKQEEFSFSKVTIKVEKILKGKQDTKSIDVYFLPTIEDEPNFSLDDKGIFFIHKYQNKYRLVQGIAGKINIENDEAKNIYMLKQKREQKLDSFVHEIEEALEKFKTKK